MRIIGIALLALGFVCLALTQIGIWNQFQQLAHNPQPQPAEIANRIEGLLKSELVPSALGFAGMALLLVGVLRARKTPGE